LKAKGVTTVVNLRMPSEMAQIGFDGVAWRASHLWGAYLIRDRKVPVETALSQTRKINLRDDAPFGGQQPIEEFLGRTIPELARTGLFYVPAGRLGAGSCS